MQVKDRVVVASASHPFYGKMGTIDGFGAITNRVWVQFDDIHGAVLVAREDLEVV